MKITIRRGGLILLVACILGNLWFFFQPDQTSKPQWPTRTAAPKKEVHRPRGLDRTEKQVRVQESTAPKKAYRIDPPEELVTQLEHKPEEGIATFRSWVQGLGSEPLKAGVQENDAYAYGKSDTRDFFLKLTNDPPEIKFWHRSFGKTEEFTIPLNTSERPESVKENTVTLTESETGADVAIPGATWISPKEAFRKIAEAIRFINEN